MIAAFAGLSPILTSLEVVDRGGLADSFRRGFRTRSIIALARC